MFITSGNWSLRQAQLAVARRRRRPTLGVDSEGDPRRLELPQYDEHYAPTLPRICCQEEEEEVFIASGNWRGKHGLLFFRVCSPFTALYR